MWFCIEYVKLHKDALKTKFGKTFKKILQFVSRCSQFWVHGNLIKMFDNYIFLYLILIWSVACVSSYKIDFLKLSYLL